MAFLSGMCTVGSWYTSCPYVIRCDTEFFEGHITLFGCRIQDLFRRDQAPSGWYGVDTQDLFKCDRRQDNLSVCKGLGSQIEFSVVPRKERQRKIENISSKSCSHSSCKD